MVLTFHFTTRAGASWEARKYLSFWEASWDPCNYPLVFRRNNFHSFSQQEMASLQSDLKFQPVHCNASQKVSKVRTVLQPALVTCHGWTIPQMLPMMVGDQRQWPINIHRKPSLWLDVSTDKRVKSKSPLERGWPFPSPDWQGVPVIDEVPIPPPLLRFCTGRGQCQQSMRLRLGGGELFLLHSWPDSLILNEISLASYAILTYQPQVRSLNFQFRPHKCTLPFLKSNAWLENLGVSLLYGLG